MLAVAMRRWSAVFKFDPVHRARVRIQATARRPCMYTGWLILIHAWAGKYVLMVRR